MCNLFDTGDPRYSNTSILCRHLIIFDWFTGVLTDKIRIRAKFFVCDPYEVLLVNHVTARTPYYSAEIRDIIKPCHCTPSVLLYWVRDKLRRCTYAFLLYWNNDTEDGVSFWLELNKFPLRLSDGTPKVLADVSLSLLVANRQIFT